MEKSDRDSENSSKHGKNGVGDGSAEDVLVYIGEIERYLLLSGREIDFSSAEIKEPEKIIGSIENRNKESSRNYPKITDPQKIILKLEEIKRDNESLLGKTPYLGWKNDLGLLILFGYEIERPDYGKIKRDNLISLKDCICILLGISDLGLIGTKQFELWELSNYAHPFGYKHQQIVSYLTNEPMMVNQYPVSQSALRFMEWWEKIILFVCNFVKKIINEIEAGFIEGFGFKDNRSTFLSDEKDVIIAIQTEEFGCNFKTLDFLKWSQKAGYEIPKELSFSENIDSIPQAESPEVVTDKERVERLMGKYTRIAEDYCKQTKEQEGQVPRQEDLGTFLVNQLKDNDEFLGQRSRLPDKKFRELYRRLDEQYKRAIGGKSRKR
ncbi:MAG: hypothetical protein KKF12_16725 [Proteobacteria bacterium]|nr:hypothetical protein [Desulfobacula sp.]MBU3954604.1 hypothetical protein [Pseudomonadota bacterium]MBU4132461.1 hypothetical protein [Pseudomonadota bacterium]